MVASFSYDLKAAAEDAHWHRRDVRSGQHARGALRAEIDVISPTRLGGGAEQASAQQIGERGVFDRADDLAVIETKRCQNFDEMQGAKIVNMLDRIVEEKGTPWRPGASQMNRQEKC